MASPASPLSARDQLLRLLARQSFRLGQFQLSSGATSDYYIDCRATTLHAEGTRLCARVVLDEINAQKWKAQGIGGLTMGADPLVVGVALISAQQIQTRAPARPKPIDPTGFHIHGFLVRKEEKAHGTAQRIEGFREKGARVVIVDDVCTTGLSIITAIEAAKAFGFEVVGAMCLVEREEAGGRKLVEETASPAPFLSIFTATQIREEHLRQQQEPA